MFFDDPPGFEEEPIRIEEPLFTPPEWFGNEIIYEDAYGELHSNTLEEWKEILLLDRDDLIYFYGADNLDIIYDLENQGLWDAEDWEEWRDAYNSVHGV